MNQNSKIYFFKSSRNILEEKKDLMQLIKLLKIKKINYKFYIILRINKSELKNLFFKIINKFSITIKIM